MSQVFQILGRATMLEKMGWSLLAEIREKRRVFEGRGLLNAPWIETHLAQANFELSKECFLPRG